MTEFKEAVIVGCGPAGLLAAHACTLAGVRVSAVLAAQVAPSYISGAQYLHRAIPALTDGLEPFTLTYRRIGTEAEYRQKIYGDRDVQTSWSKFKDVVEAWDLQKIYKVLWELHEHRVMHCQVKDLRLLRQIIENDCLIISTAPRPMVLPGDYTSEEVFIMNGDCHADVGLNEIVYYGDPSVRAYRSSNINGHKSVEYPMTEHSHPLPGVYKQITKPLSSAGAVPAGVLLAGRYGKWQKGVLVDDAFYEVQEFFTQQGDNT